MSFSDRVAATAAYPGLRLYIDGAWVEAEGRVLEDVIDPSTGNVLGKLPNAGIADVEHAIVAAERAFTTWKLVPAMERARYLREAAALLRSRRDRWASLITLELGKPYQEALRETETACEMLDWAAEEARRLYGRLIPARAPNMRMMAISVPFGPSAAISGWNAPAITPCRKVAAALGAGCTLVLKPSEATPATALMIAEVFDEISLPAGVLNVVFGDPPTIGETFATDPRIRVLSFTGGTAVGKQLAARAGGCLKRTVFELGGHAPVLVFKDCDVEKVARAAAAAKFRNSGQVCTSPTRIMVEQPVYERFAEAFAEAASRLVVGDPFDAATQMGPLQNKRRVEAIASLVEDAVGRGARILTGGKAFDDKGLFFPPTVLADVPRDARAMNEEPFGSLAIIGRFETFDQAVAEANRLPFGLAAYVHTSSLTTAERVGEALQTGTLAINHWSASFPESPFGGVKDSGVGTEGGVEGLAAFMQTRFVSVAT